jgi:hypothetical protein
MPLPTSESAGKRHVITGVRVSEPGVELQATFLLQVLNSSEYPKANRERIEKLLRRCAVTS